jgi:site-specific DNA recombinase
MATATIAPPTIATAIIYCRVSSDEQARGYSLTTQEESCRRYCEAHGYAVLDAFRDAHSGTELSRPGINAAIETVAALKPAVVILHDVDRLGRDKYVQAIAERELTRHGARIEYALGGRSDSADDVLSIGFKQLIAVYDNYKRVEASRRGKNGRAKAGGVLVGARPPYGYRAVSGAHTGSLEPHPEEASIVRQMFAWCADDGLTTYEIAARLSAASVPTRGDTANAVHKKSARYFWDARTIARILRNETHKGVWYWGKYRMVKRGDKRVQEPRPREEWIPVAVPALVDEATWERAQARLARNRADATRNAKREYVLRGRVFCPSCGRRWIGRAKKHTYYRCSHTDTPQAGVCSARFAIRQDVLEPAVLGAVEAFLLDPVVRAAGVAAERERVVGERERLAADLDTIDRHLAVTDEKLGRLLDQAIAGEFPPDMIAGRKRELLGERERRLREREQSLTRLANVDLPDIEAAVAALAPTVERAFSHATPAELRQLLDVLGLEVHVVDRETVRITGVVGGQKGALVTLSSSSRSRSMFCPRFRSWWAAS